MKRLKQNLNAAAVLILGVAMQAQTPTPVSIDINLDINHEVGGVDSFDRRKFINMHAAPNEVDWQYAGMDVIGDYLVNDLDVYFGRDNGTFGWQARNKNFEDPLRSGYADPTTVLSAAADFVSDYASTTEKDPIWHRYDDHTDVMMGGQWNTFWPFYGPTSGWKWANAEAVGEWMAIWTSNAYRAEGDTDVNNGYPANRFVEILNEPLYHFIDDPNTPPNEKATALEIFEFHRDAAIAFKANNTSTSLVGGYTEAFPDFDVDNFDEWDERMKLFMDVAGAEMDFYSLHYYDFNSRGSLSPYHQHYKGSRLEASLDMVENYSMLLEGSLKPLIISEYGGRDLAIEGQAWSSERDWIFMKAFTPLMMQFMDRPHLIQKAIPFIVGNYQWSITDPTDTSEAYPWRVARIDSEPTDFGGSGYIATDLIKFYELWSDVNGMRADTWSSNPDILVDAYVDGDKAYVIVSNISFDKQELDLNIFGGNSIQNIKVKHLHAVNGLPTLSETNTTSLSTLMLDEEASAIIEYTFNSAVTMDQTSEEVKYYGDKVKEAIAANTAVSYTINGVNVGTNNESVLRIAYGRDVSLSQEPTVVVNGEELAFDVQYAGDTIQPARQSPFLTLEVPVPSSTLQTNNTIDVTFPDAGGYIGSVALKSFNFSRAVDRSNELTDIALNLTGPIDIGVGQERQLAAIFTPTNASDKRLSWSSSNANVTVDANGLIRGEVVGSATITVTALDGSLTDDIVVNVQADRVDILVTDISVSTDETAFFETFDYQMNVDVLPLDADDNTVTWSSSNPSIATVNPSSGLVSAVAPGNVRITATANDVSGVSDFIDLEIEAYEAVSFLFDNPSKYLSPNTFVMGETMEVSANFNAGTGKTINSSGVTLMLRWILPNWSVQEDYRATDVSVVGQQSGTATVTIDLSPLIYTSAELEAAGHRYFLYGEFTDNEGTTTYINNGVGVHPIQIVEGSLSTDEEEALAASIVYPNPFTDKLTIENSDFYSQVNIYASNGVLLIQEESKPQINVSQLASGIYIVELIGKGEVSSLRTRVIKE